MRGLTVIVAALAGWTLARGPLPQFDASLPRPRVMAAGAAAAGAGFLITHGLTGVPAIAAAVGMLTLAAPVMIEAQRRRRQADSAAEAIPDFLARLRGRLAGGASLADAFLQAGQASQGRIAEITLQAGLVLRSGGRFTDSLAQIRRELDDPIVDRVLVVLASASETGGARVSDMLGMLADSVADELRLRRAYEAALTQQRLSALFALIAPWVLLVFSVATNPQSAQVYGRPGGTVVVAIGLAATLAGYLLARRTARLSRPQGVFR